MNHTPRLLAFDLDDTLAPSKSPLNERMTQLLTQLVERMPVCVISGGQFGQFQSQIIDQMPQLLTMGEQLHLMPTCGTQYWKQQDDTWAQVYAENLTADEKQRALQALEEQAKALGLWESKIWGPILEDRGSQITFSALGQYAPAAAKAVWDPTGERKNQLRTAVAAQLPDLEVRSGGSTSVDVTKKGIDKAYGMRRLAQITGIALEDMLFIGDRLDPDGNDYPVKALGVPCYAVTDWSQTADFLEQFLADSTPS